MKYILLISNNMMKSLQRTSKDNFSCNFQVLNAPFNSLKEYKDYLSPVFLLDCHMNNKFKSTNEIISMKYSNLSGYFNMNIDKNTEIIVDNNVKFNLKHDFYSESSSSSSSERHSSSSSSSVNIQNNNKCIFKEKNVSFNSDISVDDERETHHNEEDLNFKKTKRKTSTILLKLKENVKKHSSLNVIGNIKT
jgi:hypothetical protein